MKSPKQPTKTNAFLKVSLARLPALAGIVLSFVTPAKITPLAIVLIILSLMYVIIGLVRKHLKTPKQITAYVLIAIGLTVLSVLAITNLGSAAAYYILAAGFLSHTAWDTYQFVKNKVMPRWFSEFCMAYDTLIAAILVAIGLSK